MSAGELQVPAPPGFKWVASYVYRDAAGVPALMTARFVDADGAKTFRIYHFEGARPVLGAAKHQRMLYRLPEVMEAIRDGRRVYVVEGEKDADRLASLGEVATCNPLGAGKWEPQYTEALRGARVTLVVDNDKPGRQHGALVRQRLRGVAKVKVRRARQGKDVSDHLDAGFALDDLRTAKLPVAQTTRKAPAPRDDLEQSAVLRVLIDRTDAKPNGDGWIGRCPAHTDRRPSLSFGAGRLQPIALHCHAGCDPSDVLRELGLTFSDICVPRAGESDPLLERVRDLMGVGRDASVPSDHVAELQTWGQVAKRPKPEFIVDGFVPAKGVTGFYGAAGIGKTMIFIAMASAVERGVRMFGKVPTVRGGVLFYAGETLDGFGGQRKAAISLWADEAKKRRSAFARLTDVPIDVTVPEKVAEVIRTAQIVTQELDQPLGMIILDPLIEFMSGDENGSGMDMASRGLRTISTILDCAVVFGHHPNATTGVERGSKVLRYRVRALHRIAEYRSGKLALITEKQRHGDRRALLLERVPMFGSAAVIFRKELSAEQCEAELAGNAQPSRLLANHKARRVILQHLGEHPGITKTALTTACRGHGAGTDTLEACLGELIAEGAVEVRAVGKTKRHYPAADSGDSPAEPENPP